MKLLLIRGLPGSGKSTMAAGLDGFKHYEADMYFVSPDGGYKYDETKIQDAHLWCQIQVTAALADGRDVVVSNTFSRRWEMEPYEAIARSMGATVFVITCKGSYGSSHGVPAEVVQRMRARWEE